MGYPVPWLAAPKACAVVALPGRWGGVSCLRLGQGSGRIAAVIAPDALLDARGCPGAPPERPDPRPLPWPPAPPPTPREGETWCAGGDVSAFVDLTPGPRRCVRRIGSGLQPHPRPPGKGRPALRDVGWRPRPDPARVARPCLGLAAPWGWGCRPQAEGRGDGDGGCALCALSRTCPPAGPGPRTLFAPALMRFRACARMLP